METREIGWDVNEPLTYFKSYPKNSMIPAITKGINNKEMVSMLIIADRETMEMINELGEDKFDIQVTTYVENVDDSDNKNLVIRFDIFYPHAHSTYEGVIHNVNGQQREFIRVLKSSDIIDLWISDENRKVEKVIPLKWEYERAKNVLEKFIYDN